MLLLLDHPMARHLHKHVASQCDVVWAKAGRGVWGLCHVFKNTLYLTRDLMEDSAVPSNLSVPKVPEPDQAPVP